MTISVHPYASSQASKRAVKYVAPTTESATFQIIAVNGQTVTGQPVIEQDLVSGAAGCSTSGATVTCSTTVPVIVGTVTFAVKTFDQTGASGTQLGTATAGATIVANQANRIALTVSGIIAQVQLFLSPASQTPGTAGRSLLVVVPQDANGNIIVNPGTYDQPIALTLSGGTTSGSSVSHVGFEEDGATTPSATATVTSPNDQIYVAYDGTTGVAPASIFANVAEATPVSASVSLAIGSTSFTSVAQGAYLQNAGFAFTGGNQTGSITLSGGTPPYVASFQPPTPLSGSRSARAGARGGIHVQQTTQIASAVVSGSTVTVTSTAGEYGSATLYVSDSGGNQFSVPITVTAPAISIAVPSCPTGANCSVAGQTTFPATSLVQLPLTFSGGAGAPYTTTFASTSTGTSSCGTLAGSGSSYTFSSNGSCSDLLTVSSGNQSAYYAFVQPSGTAAYTVTSTSHAYVQSAGVVAIADGGQASIALTAGNGPWTTSISGPSVPQCNAYLSVTSAFTTPNNSGFVLAVTTNPSTVTTCTVNFTPTNGSPTVLTALLYPKLTVSQQVFAFHAPGDAGSVLVSNMSPNGLSVASGSIEITSESAPSVVTGLTYAGGAVGFTAGSTAGTALVSITDVNFDEKYGVSVSMDDAYAQALPSTIGLVTSIGSSQTPGSNPSQNYTNSTIPSWAISATSSNNGVGISFAAGSPGTLTLSPAIGNGTLTLADAIGGSVSFNLLDFSIGFASDAGANIGAISAEAFPGVGDTDTVSVTGPVSTFTVTSSSPSVVSVPSTPQFGSFTATAVGAGFSTITITDSTTGATVSYSASVTNVAIPILTHGRKKN